MRMSRRLMARELEKRRVREINRQARRSRLPQDEMILRARLNAEARDWRPSEADGPQLVKQAPKPLA